MKIMLICFIFLVGCMDVNQSTLQKAEEMCVEHSGIYSMSVYPLLTAVVIHCRDGTTGSEQ